MTASFHSYVCMLQWLTCLAGFIYGLTAREEYPWLWYTSLIAVFAMPIVNELFLCLKGCLMKSRVTQPNDERIQAL